MKTKETDDFIPVYAFNSGDLVQKGGKKGQVISQISPDNIVVMWSEGNFTHETSKGLEPIKEDAFSEYLMKERRI